MAQRKGSSKRTHRQQKQPEWQKRLKRLYLRWQGVIVMVGVAALLLAGGRAYVEWNNADQDIASIGSGTPVVVQLFEPSCFACQELNANMEVASEEFDDSDVEFVTLNVNGRAGSSIAQQYNARQTNLLLFDGYGNLVDRVLSVETPEQIAMRVERLTSTVN